MNLLSDLVGRCSSRPFAGFQQTGREMPAHLLGRALHLNSCLTAEQRRVARVRETLEASARSHVGWRDPELYYPLFTLAETAHDPRRTDWLLARLEVQIGVRPVHDCALLGDGVYRLASAGSVTYEVQDGAVNELAVEPLAAIERWPGLVYLPKPGLFADILPPDSSRWSVTPAGEQIPVARLTSALSLLRDLDPELSAEIAGVIKVIALMPDEEAALKPADPMQLRWSFNLRLRYFGGIFLNLYPVDVYGAVEGVVHEYYHQRIWQWWEFDRPTGIPDPQATIVSPVTGLQRQTAVMVQALVIYVGILAVFHQIDPARPIAGASAQWLRTRTQHIASRVPLLGDALREAVSPGTDIARLIDATMEHFDAWRASLDGSDAARSA